MSKYFWIAHIPTREVLNTISWQFVTILGFGKLVANLNEYIQSYQTNSYKPPPRKIVKCSHKIVYEVVQMGWSCQMCNIFWPTFMSKSLRMQRVNAALIFWDTIPYRSSVLCKPWSVWPQKEFRRHTDGWRGEVC